MTKLSNQRPSIHLHTKSLLQIQQAHFNDKPSPSKEIFNFKIRQLNPIRFERDGGLHNFNKNNDIK